jgi:Polyketide cyclase / dehydrase and lipid transport
LATSLIDWPADCRPDRSPVHVHNQLQIMAAPAVVWAWLVRAQQWPSWYENAHKVRFAAGHGPDLQPGTVFRWTTFLVPIRSVVTQFDPPGRIGWRATRPGISGYHGWVLQEAGGGCLVVTEETQHGPIAWLSLPLLRWALHHYHRRWLEDLARVAATGMPSSSPS